MLSMIVNLVVFVAALIYLAKLGFEESTINTLLAGMSGASALENVSKIIVGILTLNPGLIVMGLVLALLHGFFFNLFLKRAGV